MGLDSSLSSRTALDVATLATQEPHPGLLSAEIPRSGSRSGHRCRSASPKAKPVPGAIAGHSGAVMDPAKSWCPVGLGQPRAASRAFAARHPPHETKGPRGLVARSAMCGCHAKSVCKGNTLQSPKLTVPSYHVRRPGAWAPAPEPMTSRCSLALPSKNMCSDPLSGQREEKPFSQARISCSICSTVGRECPEAEASRMMIVTTTRWHTDACIMTLSPPTSLAAGAPVAPELVAMHHWCHTGSSGVPPEQNPRTEST